MSTAAVEIQNLAQSFGDRRALDGVSLRVEPGQCVALLGPNGSGKSTLFRIVATLLPPDAGTVRIFGHDVVAEPRRVRRCIGVVFQNASLDKKLTARENLRHQGELYGLGGAALRDRIAAMLVAARLADRADELVETYSGGMARRVEIAKGLLHRPQLLMMDEPGTGLDPGARREVWDELTDLRASEGVTVFFTTHLMDEAERADRIVILDQGRVVAAGTPDELKSAIGGDVIRIETPQPAEMRRDIAERFGGRVDLVDDAVRVERPDGHVFVPQLVEAFPGRISSIAVGKPTLEDVFIHHTGHGLYQEGDRR